MNTTSKSDSPHSPIAKPCPWDDEHRLNIENCDDGSVYVDCSNMDCPAYNVQATLEVWNRRSSSVLEELEALANEIIEHGCVCEEDAGLLHALIGRYREPK